MRKRAAVTGDGVDDCTLGERGRLFVPKRELATMLALVAPFFEDVILQKPERVTRGRHRIRKPLHA